MTRWLILFAAFALLGCRGKSPQPAPEADELGSACEPVEFEGTRFTVCTADPGRHNIQLVLDAPDGAPVREFDRLAAALGPDVHRLSFAMNAGMFDEAGAPIGLAVVGGEERHAINRNTGAGNFHLLPNGVFSGSADGGWRVDATDTYAAREPAPDFATQSGPMLVVDGALHPRFDKDGESQYLRNGVGVDAAGRAHFAISDQPVSFGRFARLFRDRLGCRQALFLDGSVSRLWDAHGGRRDGGPRMGPLLAVLDRAQERPR